MPGEPQTVYLQRTYSASEHDASHTSKIVGVWPLDSDALTPVTDGARSCPFHRQQPTTRGRCEQCNSFTLPIKYQYQSGAANVLLVSGEVAVLTLDPELPAPAEQAISGVPEMPAVQAMTAKPKRSRRKEPVAAE